MLGEGRGVRELVFNGSRCSVWEKQKVPEMNNGDGHYVNVPNDTKCCTEKE